jgi:hypothetical protein
LGGASVTALSDANTAFTDVRASTALPVELGGTTITDGSYSGGTFGLTGTLTLDGQNGPSSVFIVRTTTTLITAAARQVLLINGAQACNVFWKIGSSATLGASSTTVGHLIAAVSIDTGATTTLNGQLIALTGAVTLGGTNILNNSCTHTVTFLGNTSDGGATAAQSANTATPLTTNGFTKTGSTFSGWNTLANYTGTAYANNASYSFDADLTLYTQWTLSPAAVPTPTPVPTLPADPITHEISPMPKPIRIPVVMATATLRIIKLAVNRFGRTSLPSNFAIRIRKTGSSTHLNLFLGVGKPGAVINPVPGTYDLAEVPTSGYRGVWSGAITGGGQVIVIADQTVSVT